MGLAIVFLFLVPWLDRSPVKSIRYKGWICKLALALFAVSFVALAYLGLQPSTPTSTALARVFSGIYFLYFIGMPFYTRWDKPKPVPDRVRFHD